MRGEVRHESKHTKELIKAFGEAMRGAVVKKHHDTVTSGIPDISVTWGGVTSWCEVKRLASLGTRLKEGIQARTVRRLEEQGTAFYVLYVRNPDRTFVFWPAALLDNGAQPARAALAAPGVHYKAVAEWVMELHVNRTFRRMRVEP